MVEASVTTTATVDAAPSIPEEEITDLQRLQAYCPEATEAERNRFLAAKGGNLALAKDQLQLYLSWRKQYGLDEDYHCSQRGRQEVWENCASDDQALDELDWKFASHKAMEYESSSSQQQQQQLPQLARIIVQRDDDDHNNNNNNNNNNNRRHSCDKNGHRILQLLPAQMDLSMASESTFALCIALYLERKLCRKSYEKMTVVIDVRGGTGWANPPPQNLVPFIKQVSACLEQNFPERLAKSVIFPMPLPALLLWKMVKVFLDPNTVTKIDLVKGNASSKAKPPYRAMEEHMDKGVLEQMERLRCASFR